MPVVGEREQHGLGPARDGWTRPVRGLPPDYPDVPDAIAGVASEAHGCMAVGAWRAAVTMARRALQEAAREQGAPASNLRKEIDWLAEQQKITGSVRSAAHALRDGGNDAAHPNGFDPSEDDAVAYLAVQDEILAHLYTGPARTARLNARRDPREASA